MDFLSGIGGALVSGGLSYLGQQSTNSANSANVASSNQFNADQSQASRDWQTEMSNTQYQRAVKDMAAAGLNPMLAYHQGGAGVPSGSTASSAAPAHYSNPTAAGVESARHATQMASDRQAMRIKEPLEKGAAHVSKGIDSVAEVVQPLADAVSGLVQKVEDVISSSSLNSAKAAAVGAVGDAKDAAASIVKALGATAPVRAYQGAVTSAIDAVESVKSGAKTIKDKFVEGQDYAKSERSKYGTPNEWSDKAGIRRGTTSNAPRRVFK